MSQPPEETSRWQTYPGDPGPGSLPRVERLPAEPAGFWPEPARDLPPGVPGPLVPAPIGPAGIERPGYSPNDPLTINAGASSVRKEGVWTVPPYLSLGSGFGSILVDFRRAEVTSRVIWVQVSGGAGSIQVIIPQGWAAQTDRLGSGWGSRRSEVAEEPVGDNPVLVFSGSAALGSVMVRYPTKWDDRRLRKQLAKEEKRRR